MEPPVRINPMGSASPVPELPVAEVERAQVYYRDTLGFEIAWIEPGKEIGAVVNGRTTLFLRQRQSPFEPSVHWIFTPEIDTAYQEMQSTGANIVDTLETKPWGVRQFTIADLDGNLFHIHHG